MISTILQLETLANIARGVIREGRYWTGAGKKLYPQFIHDSVVHKLANRRLVQITAGAKVPTVTVTPRGLAYLDETYERLFPELKRAVDALYYHERGIVEMYLQPAITIASREEVAADPRIHPSHFKPKGY